MPPHKERQVRPLLQHPIDNQPRPAVAEGEAYPQAMRNLVMWTEENHGADDDVLLHARNEYLWPCERTISRWVERQQQEGHYRRYRRTGNKRATVLCGRALFHLAYYRILFPKANQYEANAFVYNVTGRLYSPSQITRAEDMLGLSRKCASTTAYQASLPRNLQIRWNYWNEVYPAGMVGIRREDIIDIDEFGAFTEQANRR